MADIERELPTENQGMMAVREAIDKIVMLVRVVGVCLLIAFMFSGIRNLEQYEAAAILRFGAVQGPIRENAGLILALPYPIDEVVTFPVRRTQRLVSDTFWTRPTATDGEKAEISPTLRPGRDGYLLFADLGILHVRCTLKYRISRPIEYAFAQKDARRQLKMFLDHALVRTASRLSVATALGDTSRFSLWVTEELKRAIRKQKLGVEIDPVDLSLAWPQQLTEQINAVGQARENAARTLATARVYAEQQQNEAKSRAARIHSEAQTWATRVISRTTADAQTFEKLFPLYQRNQSVLRRVLYQNALRNVMDQVDEVFLLDPDPNNELRLQLPRKAKARQSKKGGKGGKK